MGLAEFLRQSSRGLPRNFKLPNNRGLGKRIGLEFRSWDPIRPLDGLRNGSLDVSNVQSFMMARHKWFVPPVIHRLESHWV